MIVHRCIQGSNVPFMDEGAFPKFREHSSVTCQLLFGEFFYFICNSYIFLIFMYIKPLVPGVH